MKESVEIFDLVAQAVVEAELVDEVTSDDFLVTQLEWRPVVVEATRELVRLRAPDLVPGHFHWDWTRKAAQLELLAVSFIAIRHGGSLQGLMKTETVGHACRLPEQGCAPKGGCWDWRSRRTRRLRLGEYLQHRVQQTRGSSSGSLRTREREARDCLRVTYRSARQDLRPLSIRSTGLLKSTERCLLRGQTNMGVVQMKGKGGEAGIAFFRLAHARCASIRGPTQQ